MRGATWINKELLQSYLCLIPEIAKRQGEMHLPYYAQPLQIMGNGFIRKTYEELKDGGYDEVCLRVEERLRWVVRPLKQDRWIDMYIIVCDMSINSPANRQADIIDCNLYWTRTKSEAWSPNKITWSNRTTEEEDEKAYSDWVSGVKGEKEIIRVGRFPQIAKA